MQKTPTLLAQDINVNNEIGVIPVLPSIEGKKIACLSERSVIKMRQTENWNYENRQFSLEPVDKTQTIPVLDDSSIALANYRQYMSAQSYSAELSAHYKWKLPASDLDSSVENGCNTSLPITDATNAAYPMYFAMATGHSTASANSSVTPEYAIPYQYSVVKQSDYSPSVGVIQPSYAVNLDIPAVGAVFAHDTHLSNTAHASQTIDQSQHIYHPVQVIQNPEAYIPYYTYSPHNQTLQLNQTASVSGSSSSASTFGHSDELQPLLRWQVSPAYRKL